MLNNIFNNISKKLPIVALIIFFIILCIVSFIYFFANKTGLVVYPPGGISQCPYAFKFDSSSNMCEYDKTNYKQYQQIYNTKKLKMYDKKNPCNTKNDITNNIKNSKGYLWDGVIYDKKFSYIFDNCCTVNSNGKITKADSNECKPFF